MRTPLTAEQADDLSKLLAWLPLPAADEQADGTLTPSAPEFVEGFRDGVYMAAVAINGQIAPDDSGSPVAPRDPADDSERLPR